MGAFQPAESFAAFEGESTVGEWVLTVRDNANFDGGAITRFEITFCGQGDNVRDLSVQSQTNSLGVCSNEATSVDLLLGTGFTEEISLRVSNEFRDLDNYTFNFNVTDRLLTIDFSSWGLVSPGSYTLTFTVITGDGTERAISIPLRVTDPADAALLTSPEVDAVVIDGEVTFNWGRADGATGYIFQYSFLSDFSVIEYSEDLTGTILTLNTLPAGNIIFWRVISKSGCGEQNSEIRMLTIRPTGVQDFGQDRVLNVYPNPVRNLLTVEITGNWQGGLQAVLIDATGRHLRSFTAAGAGREQWNLSNLAAGVYYLRFTAAGTERTERIVVMP
jgi:hypothetical protein